MNIETQTDIVFDLNAMAIPNPQLERRPTSCGKHGHGQDYIPDDDESVALPPISTIPRQTAVSQTMDSQTMDEIILDVYKKELLVCPLLEFHKEHYTGLPFDAIYLTHLIEPIRQRLNQQLPFPELLRETNAPRTEPLETKIFLKKELHEKELDELPIVNPIFKRMDDAEHYN